MDDVLRIERPAGVPAPVVFDSPHSGRHFPADAGAELDVARLGIGVDRLVDELFADAPQHGAVLIAAQFSRAYIDPNRHENDLDPDMLDEPWPQPLKPTASTKRGRGLIWRYTGKGEAIYGERRLGSREIRRRIETYWRPYHDTLAEALDDLHASFGAVWHVNCHSMGSIGRKKHPDPGRQRADFTISDRDGSTCDAAFLDHVGRGLREMGYSVAINDPYRGMELIRRHGRPHHDRHSVQIEINRRLYLDEKTMRRHDGFETLRGDLSQLAAMICDFARDASRAPAA